MQILLDNGAYEFGNIGDVTMLMVAVRRLRALWPDAAIHVLIDRPDDLRRACPEATPLRVDGRNLWFQERNIFGGAYRLMPSQAAPALDAVERSVRLHMQGLAEPWIRRRLRHRRDTSSMESYLRAFREATIVAASGGGYINDSFPRHAALVLETLLAAQNRGKITALFGQGIGPLTDPALRRLARRVLPHAACIGLRERRAGLPLLQDLGVPERVMVVTGDDAVEASYEGRGPGLGDHVGVNVRVASYSGVDDALLVHVAQGLGAFRTQTPAPLAGLPISSHSGDSDVRSIERVFAHLGIAPGRIGPVDPQGLIRRVSSCRVVLTGSYHAGVFALSQGIPVVALARTAYYEDKFLGLSDQFSGGVVVTRPEDEAALAHALSDAWKRAPEIRDSLLRAAARQIESGQGAYARLQRIADQPEGAA